MAGKRAGQSWDVIIVGAGPAGLSAALILGRCRRRVLLCDSGTPRSAASHRMNAFLSQDGTDPEGFRALCRQQLAAYSNVTLRAVTVRDVRPLTEDGFEVDCAAAAPERCRMLLLATGLFDQLPPLPGIERFWGVSVHQCPYCDGWEMRDRTIAVYGQGQRGLEMARAMTAWSGDLMLCTHGPVRYTRTERRALAANGVRLIPDRIEALEGSGSQLHGIRFAGGRRERCDALFFDTPSYPQSPLAERLGCTMTQAGGVLCGKYEESSVPGVFAAGNITKGVQLSIVAAAEGARAAFGINRALTREAFARRALQFGEIASERRGAREAPQP